MERWLVVCQSIPLPLRSSSTPLSIWYPPVGMVPAATTTTGLTQNGVSQEPPPQPVLAPTDVPINAATVPPSTTAVPTAVWTQTTTMMPQVPFNYVPPGTAASSSTAAAAAVPAEQLDADQAAELLLARMAQDVTASATSTNSKARKRKTTGSGSADGSVSDGDKPKAPRKTNAKPPACAVAPNGLKTSLHSILLARTIHPTHIYQLPYTSEGWNTLVNDAQIAEDYFYVRVARDTINHNELGGMRILAPDWQKCFRITNTGYWSVNKKQPPPLATRLYIQLGGSTMWTLDVDQLIHQQTCVTCHYEDIGHTRLKPNRPAVLTVPSNKNKVLDPENANGRTFIQALIPFLRSEQVAPLATLLHQQQPPALVLPAGVYPEVEPTSMDAQPHSPTPEPKAARKASTPRSRPSSKATKPQSSPTKQPPQKKRKVITRPAEPEEEPEPHADGRPRRRRAPSHRIMDDEYEHGSDNESEAVDDDEEENDERDDEEMNDEQQQQDYGDEDHLEATQRFEDEEMDNEQKEIDDARSQTSRTDASSVPFSATTAEAEAKAVADLLGIRTDSNSSTDSTASTKSTASADSIKSNHDIPNGPSRTSPAISPLVTTSSLTSPLQLGGGLQHSPYLRANSISSLCGPMSTGVGPLNGPLLRGLSNGGSFSLGLPPPFPSTPSTTAGALSATNSLVTPPSYSFMNHATSSPLLSTMAPSREGSTTDLTRMPFLPHAWPLGNHTQTTLATMASLPTKSSSISSTVSSDSGNSWQPIKSNTNELNSSWTSPSPPVYAS